VNNVIKNADMSNTVGRPSKKAKEKLKKFQIPSEKKQQISQALQQIPLPENVQSADTAGFTHAIEEDATGAFESVPQREQSDPVQAPKGGVNNLTEANPPAGILTEEAEWGETIKMDYAGGMLMLAAFYENMDEALLGSLLSEYNGGAERKDFEKLCNAALLMSSLDINNLGKNESIFNKLAGFECSPEAIETLHNTETSEVDKILLPTKIELEGSQLGNLARGYSLLLDSGQNITLDPFLTSIMVDNSDFSYGVPLKSAVDKLSEELLVNHQPLSFTAVGPRSDDAAVLKLMAAFQGCEGHKFNKIKVLGANGEGQLEFAYITEKKRHFIYGIFYTEPEFSKYSKASQWASRQRFVDRSGRAWEYAVTRSDYPAVQLSGQMGEVNVVTVWGEARDEPALALVYNFEKEHKSLLDKYLGFFVQIAQPADGNDLGQSPAVDLVLDGAGDEYLELGHVFEKFKGFLKQHINQQYFTADNDGFTDVFALSGALTLGRDVVEVVYDAQAIDPSMCMKLKKAAKNVNKRKIYDAQHRLLRFYVN
ncbi:MAG: hypothetical protein K8I00_09165, partial [Candidatus Omnitrophica bacterium]|nr:hypothetical protein [Candidatus Omnitrophota bacterium]